MTAFRPGVEGSGGFERRPPQHATPEPSSSSPWLTIAAYSLAVIGLWVTVVGWAVPVAAPIPSSATTGLLVAGAVLVGIAHGRRYRRAARTASLVAVWVAFAVWATYIGTVPGALS